ncbi:uncharacterized protein [Physcomitrium patens]|uniref:uncharacterized protein isoform X4 n=1 Tax=Physcomitrium patens TaxID=3218 RepID=UPI003CCD665B
MKEGRGPNIAARCQCEPPWPGQTPGLRERLIKNSYTQTIQMTVFVERQPLGGDRGRSEEHNQEGRWRGLHSGVLPADADHVLCHRRLGVHDVPHTGGRGSTLLLPLP